MAIVAGLEAVALVAVVFLFIRHIQVLQVQAGQERSQLADRIQAPERLPVPEPVQWNAPDDESDELHLIGTVMAPRDEN